MIKLKNILLLVFIMHTGLQAMGRGCSGQVFSAVERFEQLSASADTAQSHAAQAGTSAVAAESRISQTKAFLHCNPTFMGKKPISPADYEDMSRKVQEVEEAHPEYFSFISGISQPWYFAFKFVGELLKRRKIEAFPGWELAICAPSNIVEGNARTFVNGNQNCRNRMEVDYSFPGQWRNRSPLDVFLKNHEYRDCAHNIGKYLCEWLEKIFPRAKNISLMESYIEMKLAEIESAIDSRRGCLLQLLVDRDGVDEHVYLGEHCSYGPPHPCRRFSLKPKEAVYFETGKISPLLRRLTDSTECEKVSSFLPNASAQVVFHRGLFAKYAGIKTFVHTEFAEARKAQIEAGIKRLVDDITHFSPERVFEYAVFLSLHSKYEKVRINAIVVLENMVMFPEYRNEIYSLLGVLLADESDDVRAIGIRICTRLIENGYEIDDVEKLVLKTKAPAKFEYFLINFNATLREIRRKGALGRM